MVSRASAVDGYPLREVSSRGEGRFAGAAAVLYAGRWPETVTAGPRPSLLHDYADLTFAHARETKSMHGSSQPARLTASLHQRALKCGDRSFRGRRGLTAFCTLRTCGNASSTRH